MTTPTEHPHIVRQENILSGEPIIKGTRTPVRSIVEKWRLGLTAGDIVHGSPHLNLAQVFDALSYYFDHKAEIDDYIRRNYVSDEMIHKSEEEARARKEERIRKQVAA